MTQGWGRDKQAGNWPSRYPVGILWAVAAGMLTAVMIFVYQYKQDWSAVERVYLPTYLQTQLSLRKEGNYNLLTVVYKKGDHRIPLDDQVVDVTTSEGKPSFALTQEAVASARSGWSGSAEGTTARHCIV